MKRPACVAHIANLHGDPRPRHSDTPGVAAIVRSPGKATGLTQMGVHVRTVAPGFASTNRHFHSVEEEWVFVLSGRGKLRIGQLTLLVGPGHFAGFSPGPVPHHFLNDGDEDLVLLEGGETRPAEDDVWYPDVRRMTRKGQPVDGYREPLLEAGNRKQLQQIESLPIKTYQHDVEPRARRAMRALHGPAGLVRQAVYWCRVSRGDFSTAMHTHDRTDEWVFILEGKAIAQVGRERFEVGSNDFIGHPAGSEPHYMEAVTDLTYLMGGTIDSEDIVEYPRHGLRRVGGQLEPWQKQAHLPGST